MAPQETLNSNPLSVHRNVRDAVDGGEQEQRADQRR
jgi:hypothetical protein